MFVEGRGEERRGEREGEERERGGGRERESNSF